MKPGDSPTNTVAFVKNGADVAISIVKSKISKGVPDIKTGGGKVTNKEAGGMKK